MKENPENNINPVKKDSAEVLRRKSSFSHSNRQTLKVQLQLYENGELNDRSLLIFSQDNSLRRLCFRICMSSYFETFILSIIVINCIFLAMDTPNVSSEMKNLLNLLDIIFNIIYTIESIIKIIAMGFVFGHVTYLRNTWNQLDFFVVCCGWIGMVLPINVNAVRCVRLLKPLKTISSVPGMRTQVNALLQSLPSLGNVILLLTFFVFVFGILGMQLFGGKLRQQCIADNFSAYCSETSRWQDTKCKSISSESVQNSRDDCLTWCNSLADTHCCSYSGTKCMQSTKPAWRANNEDDGYETCSSILVEDDWPARHGVVYSVYGRCGQMVSCDDAPIASHCGDSGMNMNHEANSFDNFPKAFVTIYQSISLEGWVDIMYAINEADTWALVVPYFILLVLFGAQFILNLLMSVIFIKFEQVKEQQVEEEKQAEKEFLAFSIGDKPEMKSLKSHNLGDDSDRSEEESVEGSDKHAKGPFPRLTNLVEDPRFDQFIIGVICINAILLGMERYDMSDEWVNFLKISNIAMTVIFLIEMVMKIVGLTPLGYISDSFNIFDGVIVIFSIIEIVLDFAVPDANLPGVAALRTFRLLRVFKLFRFLTGLQELLNAVMGTLSDLKYFSLIMLLFIFIAALLGMQMYAGKFGDSRANFNNFYWAVITVFQMLSGENWNDVMFTGIEKTNWGSAVFNICVFTAGNLIVLSLFFAILLGNFEDEEEESNEENRKKRDPANQQSSKSPLSGKVHILRKWFCLCYKRKRSPNEEPEPSSIEMSEQDCPKLQVVAPKSPSNLIVDFYAQSNKKELCAEKQVIKKVRKTKSLGLFSVHNPVRKICIRLLSKSAFDNIIMVLIALSSVCLALDEPGLDEDSTLKKILETSNHVFTALFAAEMIIKIIALGFFAHPGAYLRDGWNRLDGILVVMSMINLAIGGLESFRALRALRALRPLRMVSRFQSTKVVVNSIFYTIPSLGNVFLITVLFFYIFGIMGLQFFQGKMFRCYGITANYEFEIVDPPLDKVNCIWSSEYSDYTSLVWHQHTLGNFDNIFSSMLILFEVATLEMWPDVMLAVIDGRPELAPKRDHAPELALFFVVFIMVCGFFVMSLFIGVIVDEYQKYHDKFTGAGITDNQKMLLESIKELLLHKPTPPLHPPSGLYADYRKPFYKLVKSNSFDMFITGCILVNIVVMACATDTMDDTHALVLTVLNYVFTVIFLLEMIFKHIGLGLKQYWRDAWNRFDGTIVILSAVFFVLTISGTTIAFDPTIARVFRMLRIFRVIKRAKAIKQLIYTLIFSMPALANVALLMLLLFFVYACMGMSLFGKVKHGEFINIHANFETFPRAMLVLIRMATGESWNGIMHDAMISAPFCDESDECIATATCCGDSTFAIIYFVSFTFVSSLVMMNIFVAVILKNFEEQVAREKEPPVVSPENVEEFVQVWTNFSQANPDEMDCLPIVKLPLVINLVSPPLGMKGMELSSAEHSRFIRELHLPGTTSGKVHVMDVGMALMMRVYKAQGDIDLDTMTIPDTNELFQFLRARIYHAFPKLKQIKSEQLISGWDDAEEIRSIAVVRDLVKKKYQFMKNKNGAASEDVQHDYPLGLVPELGLP